MGCAESKDDKFEKIGGDNKPSYIAMALLNANHAAAMMASYQSNPSQLDPDTADDLIRKAKNDGQTVSVVNGCLYLDYKFAGFMPT
ncbi:unnamed protein product [Bursaphelenchus xylophilus]|uniref:(pine wood nematode) hypothetical protein n=1 Tax=Bursaphelenchus xylophilus TaxID=6326 RepID=A0A1I7SLM4_BURXY|nr:unnamed protein product [Bursaphelenchus xylophilus]CAG9129671.1 unnamed protein product [Bursaphelenchus xylophilus]